MSTQTKTELERAKALMEDRSNPENEKQALEIYLRLSRKGDPEASYALYQYHKDRDPGKARSYLEKAVGKEYAPALYDLGNYYYTEVLGGEEKGAALLFRAAMGGEARAFCFMGECLERGEHGMQEDPARAVLWYERAAKKGIPEGVYYLGCCYLWGHGVRMDTEKGYSLLRQVWDLPDLGDRAKEVASMAYLEESDVALKEKGIDIIVESSQGREAGVCMHYGQRREMNGDLVTAILFYVRAAAWGENEGYYRAAKLKLAMGDHRQAMAYLHTAAEKNCAAAQFSLFRVSALGLYGEAPDAEEAIEWLRRAGVNGSARACHQLGNLYAVGVEELEQDNKAAIRWYRRALLDRAYPGWENVRELLAFLKDA